MSDNLHGKQQVFYKASKDHLEYEVDGKKGYKKSIDAHNIPDFTITSFDQLDEEQSNQPSTQCKESLLVSLKNKYYDKEPSEPEGEGGNLSLSSYILILQFV
jgi:hypothetical protein